MDNETRQEFQKLISRFDTHEQANEREFRGIETALTEMQSAVASHVGNLRAEMVQRFEAVGQRFDGIDERFDKVDQRFDKVDQRFDKVDQRFDRVDRRFDRVEDKLDRALAPRARAAKRRGK